MPTYYSQGTNLDPLSGRNQLSHKYIKQHNNYNYNHLTILTNNFPRAGRLWTQTTMSLQEK